MRPRAWLPLAFVLVLVLPALALADPAGQGTLRILAPGDGYAVAVSASCPQPAYKPWVDPPCWLAHDVLGYDGVTGGVLDASGHVGHPFECAVTASATAPVSNALPFPANLAVADSILVGFPEAEFPTSYGGRLQRPMLGELAWRVIEAAYDGDGNALLATPDWYLANARLGPTPTVTGIVDDPWMVVWNQGGFDVTVDCQI